MYVGGGGDIMKHICLLRKNKLHEIYLFVIENFNNKLNICFKQTNVIISLFVHKYLFVYKHYMCVHKYMLIVQIFVQWKHINIFTISENMFIEDLCFNKLCQNTNIYVCANT